MIADLPTLKKIVKQGEGLHLEFKLKTSHPEKIVREVLAFANTDGGMLMIGVSDDRQVVGAKFPDEDEYILEKAIKEYCSPAITYEIERISIAEDSEREVLVFHIPKSKTAPHQIIKGDDQGKIYVRVADRSIQASKEMRAILKEMRKDKAFRFHYGKKEQILMQYIAEHGNITVKKFAEIAHITEKTASRTLILLCLAHVLKIEPEEEEDLFSVLEN
jgi:predicted HTH transcriptional regulator